MIFFNQYNVTKFFNKLYLKINIFFKNQSIYLSNTYILFNF